MMSSRCSAPRVMAASLCLALALASSAAWAQEALPPGSLWGGPLDGSPSSGSSKSSSASTAQPPASAPLPPHRPSAPFKPAGTAEARAPAAPAPTPTPALPDGRASPATVARVTDYYNSVQSMTGNFTQLDPDGTRRTGDFYMQKPGRVRFQYDPPSPVELISNGQSVAVRDRSLNTQDITPLNQTPLRFLLAERVDLANDPNVTGIFQDDRFITVTMQHQVPMLGTYRLLILFDTKTSALKQWVVTDPQGYDTQVTLSNVQVNKRPDPRLFVINFERMLQ
ncbi:outer-membrane lipoprotein carrier protein LolA [Xanthobacter agilis]|uniref:outer-membrane lipoprotein carrier protein LolA n=1 Tax=Xanthobacter agilis TaxID=47492 RepID=UPI00372BA025